MTKLKASELRIGNWVSWYDDEGDQFQIDSVNETNGRLVNPIPLTEEWLLKFGFFVSERITSEHFFGAALFQNRNSDEFVIPYEDGYHYIRDISSSSFDGSTEYRTTVIHHVHQLQNLFFALTGEELTIKENADNTANQ